MAKCYGHNRSELIAKALEKRQAQGLAYPSGKNHVMLPNGQHVNPSKRHESKKARLRRRHKEAADLGAFGGMVPVSFPLLAPLPADPVSRKDAEPQI